LFALGLMACASSTQGAPPLDAPQGLDAPTDGDAAFPVVDGDATAHEDLATGADAEVLAPPPEPVPYDLTITTYDGTYGQPLAGVRVRFDDEAGHHAERVSDARGRCVHRVNPRDGRWTVTGALVGWTVATELGGCGANQTQLFLFRLQPEPRDGGTVTPSPQIHGEFRGLRTDVRAHHGVSIAFGDNGGAYYEGRTTWTYPVALGEREVLRLFAVEVGDGRVLNHREVRVEPPHDATRPIVVEFPDPPAPTEALTVQLAFEAGGLPIDRSTLTESRASIWRNVPPTDPPYLYWGIGLTSPTTVTSDGIELSFQVPSPHIPRRIVIDPGVVIGGNVRIRTTLGEVRGTERVEVPTNLRLSLTGATLDDLALRLEAPSYRTAAVWLDPLPSGHPSWLMLHACLAQQPVVRTPRLPEGMTLRAIGILDQMLPVSAYLCTPFAPVSTCATATLGEVRTTGR